MNEKEWLEICAYNLQISAYVLQNIEQHESPVHIFADTNGFHIQNFISAMCFFGEHCSDKFLNLLQKHLNDIALFDFQSFMKGLVQLCESKVILDHIQKLAPQVMTQHIEGKK
ncbi:hypothetical protein DWX94_04225 [Coprococcus eutactus]|uniref:Uncharacterized protein n=1 Tax=Coprococcus eutactus TaxID=33043 RepID=A0A412ITT0_9FIRM|nr:hypothetical protein DWX94_04225 [Coprococcus eutactus]